MTRGCFLVEGGVVKCASGRGGKTSQDLHWQESGDSSRVGGLKAYLRGMLKGDRLRWGGDPGSVVAAGVSWTTAEGHVKRNFVGSKRAAATGIRKECGGEVGEEKSDPGSEELEKGGQRFFGMLVQIRVTPGSADDSVRQQDGRWWLGRRGSS